MNADAAQMLSANSTPKTTAKERARNAKNQRARRAREEHDLRIYRLTLSEELIGVALRACGYDDIAGGFDLTKQSDCERALAQLLTSHLVAVTGDVPDEEIQASMKTISSNLKLRGLL